MRLCWERRTCASHVHRNRVCAHVASMKGARAPLKVKAHVRLSPVQHVHTQWFHLHKQHTCTMHHSMGHVRHSYVCRCVLSFASKMSKCVLLSPTGWSEFSAIKAGMHVYSGGITTPPDTSHCTGLALMCMHLQVNQRVV